MVHRNPLKNIFCVHLFPGKRKGFQFLILCCVSFEKIAFVWLERAITKRYKADSVSFGGVLLTLNCSGKKEDRVRRKRKERVASQKKKNARLQERRNNGGGEKESESGRKKIVKHCDIKVNFALNYNKHYLRG